MATSRKLFSILFLAVAFAALPALAQSAPVNATDIPVANQVTVNQCSAGEPVALNGTLHVEYSVDTDPASGANVFSISAANNLTGVGQTSGIAYTAADSADYVLSSPRTSTTGSVQLKSDLAPQGSSATMTLVQQLQISVDTLGNLGVQLVSSTSTCGS